MHLSYLSMRIVKWPAYASRSKVREMYVSSIGATASAEIQRREHLQSLRVGSIVTHYGRIRKKATGGEVEGERGLVRDA